MEENESEVITLIRSSSDAAVALEVALKLIQEFLEPLSVARYTKPELLSVAT